MLTVSTSAPGLPRTCSLRIDVRSVLVRLALTYVAEEQGWVVCRDESDRDCLHVADSCSANGPIDVLVIRDKPSDCQRALDAVLSGAARAVVLWDDPTNLATAIDALRLGSAMIPARVIELAQEAPRLTPRQRQTLRLVAAGRSNGEISSCLHQSSSTTKRDIAELLETFDAVNRACLTTTATRLGFL